MDVSLQGVHAGSDGALECTHCVFGIFCLCTAVGDGLRHLPAMLVDVGGGEGCCAGSLSVMVRQIRMRRGARSVREGKRAFGGIGGLSASIAIKALLMMGGAPSL